MFQLPRSLDPLPGESLPGLVLRLAHRLSLSPARLCTLTGISTTPAMTSSELLLRLSPAQRQLFCTATKLDPAEADLLCLDSLGRRYPLPLSTAGIRALAPNRHAYRWVHMPHTRFCPQCLAGQDTIAQREHGGAWQKLWHLPVIFACLDHQQFLRHQCHGCGEHPHASGRGTAWLLPRMRDAKLHPAQCRTSTGPPRKGKTLTGGCGTRLDHTGSEQNLIDPLLLDLQRDIQALLHPSSPQTTLSAGALTSTARYFCDLRMLTLLICSTWPAARDLAPSATIATAIEHHACLQQQRIAQLAQGSPSLRTLRIFDSPPQDATAEAALLLIAARILGQAEPQTVLERLRLLLPSSTRRVSRSVWGAFAKRHLPACSPGLQQACEPLLHSFTRVGRQPGARRDAVVHPARIGPQHIPAFLPEHWHDTYFRHIDVNPKLVRRTVTVRLIQLIAGGSLGAAAEYLGIQLTTKQYQGAQRVHRWIVQHSSQHEFDRAVNALIVGLDRSAHPINYLRRREALHDWSLDTDTWQQIVSQLPPIPGPFAPDLSDRKRQCASEYVWAQATQGEHLFAPRPIEAQQPHHIRRDWQLRRNTIWHQLQRATPLRHYAGLRKLLSQHADQLAQHIDKTAHTPRTGQLAPAELAK